MNVVQFDGRLINTNGLTIQEIKSLQDQIKEHGDGSCIDPITQQPVSLTIPHLRAGGTIAVRGHANFLPNVEVVQLQSKFLFDPERMIDDWRGEDDATASHYDELGDPLKYVSLGQAAADSKRGESRLHVDGNQRLREGEYQPIIDEFELSSLVEGCQIIPEYRVSIPHRGGKERIIDNAFVDKDGVLRLALELQCSVLNAKHFNARISDYKALNVAQVWVLAGSAINDSDTMRKVLIDHGTQFCLWHNGVTQ